MTRKFWMAKCNDDVELGYERGNKADALKDLREAYKADCDTYGEDACRFNDYFIQTYTEVDECVYSGSSTYYKLELGKRGGVRMERTVI